MLAYSSICPTRLVQAKSFVAVVASLSVPFKYFFFSASEDTSLT